MRVTPRGSIQRLRALPAFKPGAYGENISHHAEESINPRATLEKRSGAHGPTGLLCRPSRRAKPATRSRPHLTAIKAPNINMPPKVSIRRLHLRQTHRRRAPPRHCRRHSHAGAHEAPASRPFSPVSARSLTRTPSRRRYGGARRTSRVGRAAALRPWPPSPARAQRPPREPRSVCDCVTGGGSGAFDHRFDLSNRASVAEWLSGAKRARGAPQHTTAPMMDMTISTVTAQPLAKKR